MKLYMEPGPDNMRGVGGVAQVCKALHQHLPEHGMQFVDTPYSADLVIMHVGYVKKQVEDFDVLHLHGFHYTGDPGSWGAYDYAVSASLAANLRRRLASVTVPSEWCAQLLRRDMRMQPTVLPNGIHTNDWGTGENGGYVLWNKYRVNAICNPTPAHELAKRGIAVISTFAPGGVDVSPHMKLTGKVPYPRMRELIRNASIYLATTLESQGISTIEAMASGVPVLGYNHGGTAELVRHQETGWLVEPGDIDGLVAGYHWLIKHRAEIGANCRDAAQAHAWAAIIPRYIDLYQQAYQWKFHEPHGVACVVTCYNYGHWLPQCLDSILTQTRVPDEIIVVDDGSTDDTAAIVARYADRVRSIRFESNRGIASAVNAGIAVTTQPYVFHMAADDTLAPRYVETLHDALLDDPTLGIVYSNVRSMSEDGSSQSVVWPDAEFHFETFVHKRNLIPGVAMHRREMWERLGGYQDTVSQGNSRACDYHFWLRGVAIGFQPRLVSREPLYNYRQHRTSVRHSQPEPDLKTWLPWAQDRQYPFAAPASKQPLVLSYHKPRVTVVIPVGSGHERYLPTAMESLVGQTYRDWHVLVVDDTTYGIPSAILYPYPFAQVVRTKGGEGAGCARNEGLRHVQSELLIWLDADDYLMPGAIQQMVDAHDETGRYIYGHALFLEGDTSYVQPASAYHQVAMLYETRHLVTVLMRADYARRVGGFDEQMQSMEVRDFFARCAAAGICGHLVPVPLVGYRMDAGTRRRYLDDHKTELVEYFDNVYGAYKEGKKEMACCGGKPAKPASTARSLNSSTVRMCYTGTRKGTTRYNGLKGRSYQFSASPSHKCKEVHPDDVDILLQRSGHLRVIAPSVRSAPQDPVPPPLPVVPTLSDVAPVEVPHVPEPEPDPPTDEQPAEPDPAVVPDLEETDTKEDDGNIDDVFDFAPPRKRGRPRKNAS